MLKGVKTVKDKSAICFALCGFDGGRLAKLADYAIIIPSENFRQAEDVHLVTLYLVSLMVKERLKEQKP